MRNYEPLITGDGDARNGVHSLGMQEMGVLCQIADVYLVSPKQRVLERDVHGAVAVFNVENNRIAAGFAPATNNVDPVIASRHQTGQVNSANFEVLRDRYGLLNNGCIQHAGAGRLLPRFQERTLQVAISAANSLS